MKRKLITGITLAVVLATGLWWGLHRSQPVELPVTKFVKPDTSILPKPSLVNRAKMITVNPETSTRSYISQLSQPAPVNWPLVQSILDPSVGFQSRLGAIKSLSSHLTDTDQDAIRQFLLTPDRLDKEQTAQVIKNNLMNALCALNPPSAGLGDVLIRIYQDHQQDEVIRDYAVQHLVGYYEQMAEQGNNAATLLSIKKALLEAVHEPAGSIDGTALLALNRLSQEYTSNFDREQIGTAALAMAGNPYAGELSHITAYQVCAQIGNRDALPIVLKAAEHGETMTVRLSAVGALGLLGGPDQIPYLSDLLKGTDDRFKPAAKNALRQIAVRQNQMANRN